jgi:hypothetical protein
VERIERLLVAVGVGVVITESDALAQPSLDPVRLGLALPADTPEPTQHSAQTGHMGGERTNTLVTLLTSLLSRDHGVDSSAGMESTARPPGLAHS